MLKRVLNQLDKLGNCGLVLYLLLGQNPSGRPYVHLFFTLLFRLSIIIINYF